MPTGRLFKVMSAVLPVRPKVKPPKVLPPVVNSKSLLVVTALVKPVSMPAFLFSKANVPAPLKVAAALMAVGCATLSVSVPALMVVAPTVPTAYRLASVKVKLPAPSLVKLPPVLLSAEARLMFWPLVSIL